MEGEDGERDADGINDAFPFHGAMLFRAGQKAKGTRAASKRAPEGGPSYEHFQKKQKKASKGGLRPAGASEISCHHPHVHTYWQVIHGPSSTAHSIYVIARVTRTLTYWVR
jgi:hypothetical protein